MNNNFVGTGRLGRDPELRYTPTGKAVVDLGVAFQNSTRVKGSDPPEYRYSPTIWVSVTLWEQMAENAANVLSKGDELLCVGSLELEEFERTRGERAGEKDSKLVLKNAEVTPSIRRKVPGAIQRGSAQRQQTSAVRTPDPAIDRRPPADDPWGADKVPF